jgi:two-component system cell cycle response regulator
MKVNFETISKKITLRYVLALGIIAVLSLSAFVILKQALQKSYNIASVVNISGKQRMLSQRLALDAYRLQETFKDANRFDERYRNSIIKSLSKKSNEMLKANQMLSHAKLSTEVSAIYFSDLNLATRVEQYVRLVRSVLETKDYEEIRRITSNIAISSEEILHDLDVAVAQYQKEGEEKLELIESLESFVFVLTIIALLLEVIFIFQPMVRSLLLLASEKSEILNSLEQTVELRTIHLEEANKKLNKLANHDVLTGLRNRLRFEDDLTRLIASASNNHGDFAVLMFDIDWFKEVNDLYGHNAGDKVLQDLAALLMSSFRDEDRVYRTGGEEFVVLIDRISLEDAKAVANNFRLNVMNHPFVLDTETIHKTVSAGLYHSQNKDADSFRNLMNYVDIALYEAKNRGRNRVVEYSDEMLHTEAIKESKQYYFIFKDDSFNTITALSEDIEELLGYKKDEFLKNQINFKNLVHKDDLDIYEDMKNSITSTMRLICKDGRICIARMNSQNKENEVLVELEDVKELFKNTDIKNIIANFNAMMDISDDYIYFKDQNHVLTAGSKTLVNVTSVNDRSEFVGKTDYEVFDSAYADEYYKLEKDVFNGKVEVAQDIQPTLDNDGNEGVVDNRKYPIKNSKGEIIGLFGVARVIIKK